jgi:glycosyltransferase involved in cell wall biosynthesis
MPEHTKSSFKQLDLGHHQMNVRLGRTYIHIFIRLQMGRPIAIVSVINDLVTDNRVRRTCRLLANQGYDVTLIGRKLPNSLPLPQWEYKAIRMKMLFKRGPAFYLFFNLRLTLRLLFSKAKVLYANDLDTLLPNYLASRIKRIPLVYDSHELFCDVPELMSAPLKRQVWQKLEKAIVPRLRFCITVNDSIAATFSQRYGVNFHVVRNVPELSSGFKPKGRQELGLLSTKKIILMQGSGINVQRGAEELVQAMSGVKGAILLIIGGGDVWEQLEKLVYKLSLGDKVVLKRKMPLQELLHYTYNADLGISIDKNTNPNYYLSLPNKLFDYIHAGVPVLCSRLPEIEKIVTEYQVGEFIEEHTPSHLAERLNAMLNSPKMAIYKANTLRAAAELNWDKEKEKLLSVIRSLEAARRP